MPSTGVVPAQVTCPSCRNPSPVVGPASERTGSVVATCRRCGCHWLANPATAEEISDQYDFGRDAYQEYVDAKRKGTLEQAHADTLDRLDSLIGSGGRALFDVGAGAGEFVDLARERGFEPHGNELAPGAIAMAKELTGIDLHLGDLASIEGEDLYDAVTMWCVLAHVSDPESLLTDILRILKPGGVLFLQTPRWSAMDTMAYAAARVTRGRIVRVLDRRVNDAHMVLNSARSLSVQAERVGFEVVRVDEVARYSLKTESYLGSLGVPTRLSHSLARGLDLAVDRNLFFRNVLDFYARKPQA